MSVTGLQMRRIQTVADLTADFYAQVLRQWMLLLCVGEVLLIGFAPQCVSSQE